MNYNIIPQLKNIKVNGGDININDFYLHDDIINFVPVTKKILLEGNYTGTNRKYPIKYVKKYMRIKDAYEIEIKRNEILVYSESIGGVIYGISTLSELDILNNGILEECEIKDEPDMEFRAISDDISRGQVSTYENFQEIIRNISRYKYNIYMPYIEDVFKLECCPEWGKYSDGLNGHEWKALSEYAKQYNIQIRPITNLLGHFDKNASIKELQEITVKKDDGSVTSVIDPLNSKVRPLISNILDEIIDAFGKGIIHVGGDEPFELTEVYGKDKGGQAFIDHYTWIYEELKNRGCDMMMYADFFAPPWGDYSVGLERSLELPKGINFVFWDYGPREHYPYVEKLTDLGLEVTVSPGTWTWNRFACDIKVSWDNTKGLIKTSNKSCNSMIMSSWGDGGDCPRELTWPGILIGANFSWNNNSSYDFKEFYYIYHKGFLGLNEENADKLYNIYHYDKVLDLEDNFIFKMEFFNNPIEISEFKFKEKCYLLIEEMDKAIRDIRQMKPKRNLKAFDALILGAMRIKFTAEKLTYLPWEKLKSRGEAMSYTNKVLYLAGEVEKLRNYHEKIWFATNRRADWGYVDTLYKDLRDQLYSFERRLKNFKRF